MLRSDYIDNYRKIKLKNKQIKDISEFIERYMLLGSRHCSESCGWVDTFNDFYWYIIGEADCKDIFSDEYSNPASVLSVKNIEINQEKIKLIENFVDFIKSILTDLQYNELKKSMKELYVNDKEYVEKEYYLENKYSKGKMAAKYYFLKELMKK